VLDDGVVTGKNLSDHERAFYLCTLTPVVPAERNAFRAILGALSDGPLAAAAMASRLMAHQKADLPEAVRKTSRSGALARLADLGGIVRRPIGRSATYQITSLGRRALERLSSEVAS
jgi:hypothetical protein